MTSFDKMHMLKGHALELYNTLAAAAAQTHEGSPQNAKLADYQRALMEDFEGTVKRVEEDVEHRKHEHDKAHKHKAAPKHK